jgi:hypothetical protein
MNRVISLAGLLSLVSLQSYASTPQLSNANSEPGTPAPVPATPVALRSHVDSVSVTPVSHFTEVPVEKDAPQVEGHPLTAVVVTQCNLIVAVYMTMPDGRLLRFDHSNSVPSDELLTMAYSATRSERVEVSCNDLGAAGYEKHDPV